MGITVTLRGGSGDMLMSTYDPNLDGVIAIAELDPSLGNMKKSIYDADTNNKIALANLEVTTRTPAAIGNIFETGREKSTPSSTVQYYVYFTCLFKGTYSIIADIKHTSANAAHYAAAHYNVNGGGSTIIDTHENSDTYVTKTLSGTISCNEGDVVGVGIKSETDAVNYAYIKDVRIRLHTFETVQ